MGEVVMRQAAIPANILEIPKYLIVPVKEQKSNEKSILVTCDIFSLSYLFNKSYFYQANSWNNELNSEIMKTI